MRFCLGHGKIRQLFLYATDYVDLLLKSLDVTLATLTLSQVACFGVMPRQGEAQRSQLEADAMIGIAQEGLPAGARFQNTLLVFPSRILSEAAAVSDNPNHVLGQVDVQIVAALPFGSATISH